MRYLLDTNHLGEATRAGSSLNSRIADAHRVGHRFGTILPALCETQAGLIRTADPGASRRRLADVLDIVRVWPMEISDALRFAELSVELQSRGRVLSAVDRMIAAVVLRLRATLLTTDRDFEALPEVPAENWLATPTGGGA
jgi:tRNA(fMet)-specific endonuclease VapC